jgi:hypothetical protein
MCWIGSLVFLSRCGANRLQDWGVSHWLHCLFHFLFGSYVYHNTIPSLGVIVVYLKESVYSNHWSMKLFEQLTCHLLRSSRPSSGSAYLCSS